MRRHPPLRALSALLLALPGVVGGCGVDDRSLPADGRPRVVASIFPLGDLARRVAGGALHVDVLLPPRASPATFEITPREVRAVAGATLHLAVGGGLDAWATDLVEASARARIVVVTEGTRLEGEGHGEGTGNPHVWLDPIRTRDELLPTITDALAAAAPDSAPAIRARAAALADSLTALDGEIRAALARVESRAFVATHPAWTYYARRYGLREVGTVHRHPGQEPSARHLAGLVDEARAAGVRVVFSEPQVAGTAARALATELGVPVRILDPLGGPGVEGRDGYLRLLRWNTGQLVRGLGGGAPGRADHGGRDGDDNR